MIAKIDKIAEIVIGYIENLERIERELNEDVEYLTEALHCEKLSNRFLMEALERIANHEGKPAEIASVALDGMTCAGQEKVA